MVLIRPMFEHFDLLTKFNIDSTKFDKYVRVNDNVVIAVSSSKLYRLIFKSLYCCVVLYLH